MALQTVFDRLLGVEDDGPAHLDPGLLLRAVQSQLVALQGWRHPLGFLHVELTSLVKVPQGCRFRLHIWDNTNGTIDELGDLHDHVWDLRSWVLHGALIDVTYGPTRSDSGEFWGSRITYGARNVAGERLRYDLNRIQERRIEAGNYYTIPYGTVHSSSPALVPTVTLLVSFENPAAALEGPLVLSPSSQGGGITAERVQVSADELMESIDEVLRIVK